MIGNETLEERASTRRRSSNHVWWKEHLYRKVQGQLVVVVTKSSPALVLRSLRNQLGHLALKELQALVGDRFGWPTVLGDVTPYVKTCDTC